MHEDPIMKIMKNKVKIKWFSEKQRLLQGVKKGLQFAFVSQKNEQCMPLAYCKDYLQDAIQAHLLNKKKKKYGFIYDPEVHPKICIEKCKLLVAHDKDKNFKDNVPKCLMFLNQIEDRLGIKKTVARCVSNPEKKYLNEKAWVFTGSKRWLKSPPMISLYALLIRVGFSHKPDESFMATIHDICENERPTYQSVDKFRLRTAKKGFYRILVHGDKKIFHRKIEDNYPSDIDIHTMHNKMGISAFSSNVACDKMPHWYRLFK